ncbi:TIGR03862 family flavoprotein [Pseudooceanicola algae]|uniref:3-dehydro-bile acid delta(4,6)-reductase n=1 Tax=Pseudooceanicola algae TaxID=1537215 RepID=A0A418SG15_9RHOB|nr:TIGR03862 family flavoprotein [Pseudooceanicola algae]QPM91595.1 3-dehydro-bile acid delta(4,6)-reductase [Pseudooceanicola algae]
MAQALVIGGGPAGLMAAGALARGGHAVTLVEQMPTMGRKVLMAGKSGLNLTRDEDLESFLSAYEEAAPQLRPALQGFGPEAVQDWARDLGETLFTGSTGRVFPVGMKASPLLRAWLTRLAGQGVTLRTRWRWTGWDAAGAACFQTPEGVQSIAAEATVLACGGASWPRLGSDAAWAGWLPVVPFRPANCGFRRRWSDHMTPHFGAPIKSVALRAGNRVTRGECVLTRDGIEGGAIYTLSRALRDGAPLLIDLAPDLSVQDIARRLAAGRPGESLSNRLRKALKLDPVKRALINELARPLPTDPLALAERVKALPLPLEGAQDMARAISTAGGVPFEALTEGLMLRARPGVFAAGEMLDWEAPTGGYLLTACLATGLWAGRHAAEYLDGTAS